MKDQTGRYRVECGQALVNRIKAVEFRQRIFKRSGSDEDRFDDISEHCLIFDKKKNEKLVLVFRARIFESMKQIQDSYTAQYYGLKQLENLSCKPLELGRFCVDPASNDPFLLVFAFKYLYNKLKNENVNFVFGCSSFNGAEVAKHSESLMFLGNNYLADASIAVEKKSDESVDLGQEVKIFSKDRPMDYFNLPPLLKFYLRLGGRVSDHAVIDNELDTLHVFTYLDLRGRVFK